MYTVKFAILFSQNLPDEQLKYDSSETLRIESIIKLKKENGGWEQLQTHVPSKNVLQLQATERIQRRGSVV